MPAGLRLKHNVAKCSEFLNILLKMRKNRKCSHHFYTNVRYCVFPWKDNVITLNYCWNRFVIDLLVFTCVQIPSKHMTLFQR